MENQQLLNNILLIIILLLVANYISNGTVLQVLRRYYEKLLNIIQNFDNTDNINDNKINYDNNFKHICKKKYYKRRTTYEKIISFFTKFNNYK